MEKHKSIPSRDLHNNRQNLVLHTAHATVNVQQKLLLCNIININYAIYIGLEFDLKLIGK